MEIQNHICLGFLWKRCTTRVIYLVFLENFAKLQILYRWTTISLLLMFLAEDQRVVFCCCYFVFVFVCLSLLVCQRDQLIGKQAKESILTLLLQATTSESVPRRCPRLLSYHQTSRGSTGGIQLALTTLQFTKWQILYWKLFFFSNTSIKIEDTRMSVWSLWLWDETETRAF